MAKKTEAPEKKPSPQDWLLPSAGQKKVMDAVATVFKDAGIKKAKAGPRTKFEGRLFHIEVADGVNVQFKKMPAGHWKMTLLPSVEFITAIEKAGIGLG